jgi:hypothetical protein
MFIMVLLLDGTGDLSSRWEPRLLRSHWGPPLPGSLSTATCAHYSAGGIDLRRGGDVIHVRLPLQIHRSSKGNIGYVLGVWLQ